MSHLWRTENTVVKTTIAMPAITTTSINEELERISISARLYHPERKLTTMAITRKAAKGRPTYNCLSTFLRERRFASQYSMNFSSSGVSILQNYDLRQ